MFVDDISSSSSSVYHSHHVGMVLTTAESSQRMLQKQKEAAAAAESHHSSNNNKTAVALWAQNLPFNVVVHRVGPAVAASSTSNHHNHPAATIVTAYFRVRSKYSAGNYENQWMPNLLSLKDPMVIYTQPGALVETMKKYRQHAPTVIIELELDDLPVAQLQNPAQPASEQEPVVNTTTTEEANGTTTTSTTTDFPFWVKQVEVDPEKKRHKSYQLFWIWLSKTWLVQQQAVRRNGFGSDFFM